MAWHSRVINVDKHAAYPAAVEEPKREGELPVATEFRQNKYLNNLVEQDHRNIKRLVKSGLGFGSFHRARHTLQGNEAMAMIHKGRLQDVKRNDIAGQGSSLSFIASLT
ncbi:MAG: DDE-type integrase/transposase/recombinase [Cyanobacteria bacterium J06635_15]